MKKLIFLTGAFLLVSLGTYAQDDDMYFTPSKTSKAKKTETLKIQEGTYDDDAVYGGLSSTVEDYNGKSYSDAEVDAYNRRGYKVSGDTLFIGDGDSLTSGLSGAYADELYDNDYYYSHRMARFHDPVINIYYGYGVPYWGWHYGYYDYWDWYTDPYWYWTWNWGWNVYPWHYAWYGSWGWNYPWHGGWYGGWHSHPGAPRYYAHEHGFNGGRSNFGTPHYNKVGSAGGRIWAGGRNYRDANSGRSNSYSSSGSRRYEATRSNSSSRSSNMSSRSYNSGRSYSSSSTRSMGSSSGTVGGSSRSISSGGASMGSRSFGGGGGRSFGGGGGGGRSGGGRR